MFQMKRKRARENTQFSVAVPARMYKIKKYRDGERLSRWGNNLAQVWEKEMST